MLQVFQAREKVRLLMKFYIKHLQSSLTGQEQFLENIKKLKEVINLENSVISKLEKSGKDINIKYKWIMKVNKYVTKRGQSKLTIKYMK